MWDKLFPLSVVSFGILTLIFKRKRQQERVKPPNYDSLEEDKTAIGDEINPFADDLQCLIDIQTETLRQQIDLLAYQYKTETDDKKRIAILNKLTTAQNKLIKITKQNMDNWKGPG